MAKLSNIKAKTEKRVDISRFVKDIAESPEEVNFITIKKMTNLDKKKLDLLSVNTFEGKRQSELLKEMAKRGYTKEKLDKLTDDEKLEMWTGLDMEGIDITRASECANDQEKLYLECCIDPLNHSFIGDDGKPIELGFSFWDNYGYDKFLKFVIDEIKAFSKGFSLGE